MTITLPLARITRILALIVAGLLCASLAGAVFKFLLGAPNVKGLVPLFDLNGEANIPTWYSSVTLLTAAALLAVIAAAMGQRRARYRRHWLGLALIFLYLSADEAARIHELAIVPLQQLLGARGALTFAWVIPGAILVVIGGLWYRRFILDLEARTRRLVILAAAIYVGGALGMELIGGWVVSRVGSKSPMFMAVTTVEELMEMAGILIFLHALVRYIGTEIGEVRFRVGQP